MRDIKFRQWSTLREGFYYWDELTEYGVECVFESEDDSEFHNPPQQYIGLKDKKGKEIYEGDIYRDTIEHDTHDDTIYYVCVWIKEICCFGWLSVGDLHKYQDNGFSALDDQGIPFNCVESDYIAIIGNIYEKPSELRHTILS